MPIVIDEELYKRVASLEAMGVPTSQIADVVGKEESWISQIKNTQEYKILLSIEHTKYAERNRGLNDSWDDVETKALRIIQKTLGFSANPDFALKAALVANKAQRRGGTGNLPLPAHMGDRAVINLNQVFIGKLERQEVALPSPVPLTVDGEVVKQENLMSPGEVQNLLTVETDNTTIGDNIDSSALTFAEIEVETRNKHKLKSYGS